MNEFRLIEKLTRRIPADLREAAGLRDDTGILSGHRLITTDVIVDGVDFILRQTPPELIGRKAMAVNLSDIAAMGGIPEAYTVALGIPASVRSSWLERLYQGIVTWAKAYRLVCAGGDISKASQFFVSVTMTGKALAKPVLRSGARAGDWLGVTGKLGGSIYGHHLKFQPRVLEGQELARSGVSAMIDISDGFLQDLGHILTASQTGACIETENIPCSRAALKAARGDREKALIAALSDGEDFELLFCLAPAKKRMFERQWNKKFPQTPLSWVGRIEAKKGIRWAAGGQKRAAPRLVRKGYQHFV